MQTADPALVEIGAVDELLSRLRVKTGGRAPLRQIGAVPFRLFNMADKGVFRKNARILGKEAEQEAHETDFPRAPLVTCALAKFLPDDFISTAICDF
ncbi:MAG: hypothetical protein LBD68_05115 [Zoogloeaceae bacterium]|nr:hypothetical protein [Zoogloeaceae bacterium]